MRPFSCKSFFLCPACAQKRALLLGEYLSGNLLLNLPHRQFVWTIPKVLRSFLRHDRNLFADIGRLIFDILSSYFGQAAGRPICGAMVSRYRLYSSRGRGTWKDRPALASRAPQNWYGRQAAQPPAPGEPTEVHAASASDSRKAWARLLAMIYDVDPWRCPVCGSTTSMIAVIRDPAEIRTIIACLAKHGRGPPDDG